MPAAEDWVVVYCAEGELPQVGERVHVEKEGDDFYLVVGIRRLRAMHAIDENQEPVDKSHVRGIVRGLQTIPPVPGAYPDDMTAEEIIELDGQRYAVFVVLVPDADGTESTPPE